MRLHDLEILRWAHGGDGVGVPTSGPLAGMVVFVRGAVPGDVVEAEIIERKKRWARAALRHVTTPSAERVPVPCAIQATCGGCPWMQGSAGAQRTSRLAILRGEVRKHLGWSADEVSDRVQLAPEHGPSLGYRGRLRLGYRVAPSGRVTLGFRAPRSHALVDVERCAVAVEPLSAALEPLREALEGRGPGEGEASLLSGQEGVSAWIQPASAAPWRWGPARLTIQAGDYRWSASPEGFFQANVPVTAAIADAIVEALGPPETPRAHAVELFAGNGTLTVALLRAGYRVTAYEMDDAARANFRANTEGHGEATWHVADLLGTGTPLPSPEPPEVVLLDPPRQGAHEIMPWVRASGARRIAMVSCDVSTAMRDLEALTTAYDILSITGWNMFPHTGHQETLTMLQRR